MCLVIIFVQGGETLFPILAVSVGHGNETGGKVGPHRKGLLVNGTTMISAKRGIQWDRCQIGVSGRGQVHGKKNG
jgi:hypothetical protein